MVVPMPIEAVPLGMVANIVKAIVRDAKETYTAYRGRDDGRMTFAQCAIYR